MCHCYSELTELSEEEQTELVEKHTTEEIRAEYSAEELETLGVTG